MASRRGDGRHKSKLISVPSTIKNQVIFFFLKKINY